MGCSPSKLDDEEAVQLCKDRKRFVKQAVENRIQFAIGHLAYVQSLKRVSEALRGYVEEDEPREFLLDSFITPPFTPVKNPSQEFISISPNSFPRKKPVKQIDHKPTLRVNYMRAGGSRPVSVQETSRSPDVVRVQSYSPMHHYGMDGSYGMQSQPMDYSFFSYYPENRTIIPPPSPQTSHWDGFWNPFSSLDYYGYPSRFSLDQMNMDDDLRELRQVREEEGIPDLEDETEVEEVGGRIKIMEERPKVDTNRTKQEGLVEDVDDEDEKYETDSEVECEEHEVNELKPKGNITLELSRSQKSGQVEKCHQEMAVGKLSDKAETPGFTVYVNRRPTSMSEVIKDLEEQFKIACDSAKEVSTLLESGRSLYSSSSNELTAMKMLNPVALLRSGSFRSSSSRFLITSSSSRDEGYESNSDFSEESCICSSSHQSTLDRLYAWEKKLFEEVRSGERIRIAYEKKCKQLRNQDVKGEDYSIVDKTRAAMRDLDTQLKVSIHSIEAISKRIEVLRDEELQPQLVELVKGLSRMWKVMAECHQTQKRTIDEAKLLLAGMPLQGKRKSSLSVSDPQRLAKSATNLETELRNWRSCFEAWITSQRSYIHALTGWFFRCARSDLDSSKLPLSPRRCSGMLPIFGLFVQWSRFLDSIQEVPVIDGLDFFAAGMGSLYAQWLKDDSRRVPIGSKRYTGGSQVESGGNHMEIVEAGEVVEEVITVEKMTEVAIRVLCAGMSVAISSLSDFALSSAEGYAELVKQWENSNKNPT